MEPPTADAARRAREIKFRAWRIAFEGNKAEMFQGDSKGYLFAHAIQNPETYKLMQFTGLKDKNGREIYEGDIIRSNSHSPDRFTVEFIEGGFCATHPGLDGYPTDLNHFYPSVGCLIDVVGNIYENPDLLTRNASAEAQPKPSQSLQNHPERTLP
jgi:uncharacterized phage protein (TIGR01671 family)